MKKYLSYCMLICITLLTLTGCFSPKLSAEESVLALYDLYILGDSSGVIELGMTEEDVAAALDTYDQSLADTLSTNMASAGLTVEASSIDEIVAARKEALKAMTVSCELVSSDGNSAVVLLKTTYFDEAALDEKAANDAVAAMEESNLTDYDELLAIGSETYVQNLIDGYLAVTPSEEIKEITVNCTLSDRVWLPEDMSAFGKELGLVISGQQ